MSTAASTSWASSRGYGVSFKNSGGWKSPQCSDSSPGGGGSSRTTTNLGGKRRNTTVYGGNCSCSVDVSSGRGWSPLAMTFSWCGRPYDVVHHLLRLGYDVRFLLPPRSVQPPPLLRRGVSVTPPCVEDSSGRAPMKMFSSVSGRGNPMARTLSDVGRGQRLYGVWDWAGPLPSARDGPDQETISINWSASGKCCLTNSIVWLLVSSACWSVKHPSIFSSYINPAFRCVSRTFVSTFLRP